MTEPAAILRGSRCWLRLCPRGGLYGVVVVTAHILALVHRWSPLDHDSVTIDG